MASPPQSSHEEDLTVLIRQATAGDQSAAAKLYEQIYGDLHRVASAHMRDHQAGFTLQPTALVHEAWMRLVNQQKSEYGDREHFLSVASRAMRSALVDHARRRNAQKRGGDRAREPIEVAFGLYSERSMDLIALDDALQVLAEQDPRQANVIELRFFGGLSIAEIGQVLDLSKPTVDRDLRLARIFLREELSTTE